MTKKHSANVETSFLEDAIKKAVSNWDNAVAKAETLTARAIEHEQGLTILGNLVRMGALSDRMSGEIAKVWNSLTISTRIATCTTCTTRPLSTDAQRRGLAANLLTAPRATCSRSCTVQRTARPTWPSCCRSRP